MNRALFMAKIHAVQGDVVARQIELAYLLAKKLHKGQVRKEKGPDGEPLRYFEHLRRSALSVIDEAGILDCDVIVATLLHDSIEDTEEVQLVGVIIERLFGAETATIIRAVTKVPKAGYIERLYSALPETGGRVAIVKAADRLDNLRSLPVDDPAFCEKQRKETRDVFLPFFTKAEAHIQPKNLAGFQRLVSIITSRV